MDEVRMLAGGGIARHVGCSSLTIRGFRRRLFPRSSERGPIEARLRLPVHHPKAKFPRSSERAPIEARRRTARPGLKQRYFRAHLSAAPLKRSFVLELGPPLAVISALI